MFALFLSGSVAPLMAAEDGCCGGSSASAPVLKVIAAAAAPSVSATDEQAAELLAGYADVSGALYKDDLEAAKKAAASLAKLDDDGALAKPAKEIAESATIEDARKHFKELSNAAIPMAKKHQAMVEVHCPMASGGKGASWLQKTAGEIQNPYMGAKMPHCGAVVK